MAEQQDNRRGRDRLVSGSRSRSPSPSPMPSPSRHAASKPKPKPKPKPNVTAKTKSKAHGKAKEPKPEAEAAVEVLESDAVPAVVQAVEADTAAVMQDVATRLLGDPAAAAADLLRLDAPDLRERVERMRTAGTLHPLYAQALLSTLARPAADGVRVGDSVGVDDGAAREREAGDAVRTLLFYQGIREARSPRDLGRCTWVRLPACDAPAEERDAAAAYAADPANFLQVVSLRDPGVRDGLLCFNVCDLMSYITQSLLVAGMDAHETVEDAATRLPNAVAHPLVDQALPDGSGVYPPFLVLAELLHVARWNAAYKNVAALIRSGALSKTQLVALAAMGSELTPAGSGDEAPLLLRLGRRVTAGVASAKAWAAKNLSWLLNVEIMTTVTNIVRALTCVSVHVALIYVQMHENPAAVIELVTTRKAELERLAATLPIGGDAARALLAALSPTVPTGTLASSIGALASLVACVYMGQWVSAAALLLSNTLRYTPVLANLTRRALKAVGLTFLLPVVDEIDTWVRKIFPLASRVQSALAQWTGTHVLSPVLAGAVSGGSYVLAALATRFPMAGIALYQTLAINTLWRKGVSMQKLLAGDPVLLDALLQAVNPMLICRMLAALVGDGALVAGCERLATFMFKPQQWTRIAESILNSVKDVVLLYTLWRTGTVPVASLWLSPCATTSTKDFSDAVEAIAARDVARDAAIAALAARTEKALVPYAPKTWEEKVRLRAQERRVAHEAAYAQDEENTRRRKLPSNTRRRMLASNAEEAGETARGVALATLRDTAADTAAAVRRAAVQAYVDDVERQLGPIAVLSEEARRASNVAAAAKEEAHMIAVQSRNVPRFLAAIKAMDPTYPYDAGAHTGAVTKPIFKKLAETDTVVITQDTRSGKPRVYETGAVGVVDSQPVAVFRNVEDMVPTVAVSRPDGSVEQLVTRGADVDQLRNPATIDALVHIVAAAPSDSALTSELISDVAAVPGTANALKSVRERLEMRAAAQAVGVTPPPLTVPRGRDLVAAAELASIAINTPAFPFKEAAMDMLTHPEKTMSLRYSTILERGTYNGAPVLLEHTTTTSYLAPINAWQVRDGVLVKATGDTLTQILDANPAAHVQLHKPLYAALAAVFTKPSEANLRNNKVVLSETRSQIPYRVRQGGPWFNTAVTTAPDGGLRWLSKDGYVIDPVGYLALYKDALARGDAETVRAMTPVDGMLQSVTVAGALPTNTPPALAETFRIVFNIP